jgi:hypothetical protein
MTKLLKVFATSLMTLFLVQSQSNAQEAIEVKGEKKELLAFYTTTFCDVSENVFGSLIAQYGEKPLAMGDGQVFSSSLGAVVEGQTIIFVNPKTFDFTVVMQFADGISCILTSGENFTPYTSDAI